MNVVGVRFKKAGKIHHMDPSGLKIEVGQYVIAETMRGVEYGTVEMVGVTLEDSNDTNSIKKIIRIATEKDKAHEQKNKQKAKDAFVICIERIKQHKLDMKLIDAEFTFDLNKLIFYFTSDGRVDFRELVKELASVFKTRIELRQIGVRDEAKIMNSIGACGRSLCCATFLDDFQPVSIKMAKDQSLSLNPTKISGVCGRLMCCLKYEEETYEYLTKALPREGDYVETPDGRGNVLSVSVLRQIVKTAVKQNPMDDPKIAYYSIQEIKVLKARNVDESSRSESRADRKLDKELREILD